MSVALSRFFSNPVIPVVVIDDARQAVPLAETLLAGGINAIEITLRTEQALAAMAAIAKHVPDMLLTAGTALNAGHLQQVKDAGASLVVSPGISVELLDAAKVLGLTLLPGIASVLGFNDTERGRVLHPIALWTVASYGPESARRLAGRSRPPPLRKRSPLP